MTITNNDLSGKTALITGASGGIGQAIARAMVAQGVHVILSGTRAHALTALQNELGPGHARTAPCNLADANARHTLIDAIGTEFPPIDILVNNAGVTADNLLIRLSDDDWQKVIDVNLTAAEQLSRAVLKSMMRARWGRIVNMASVVGITGNPGQTNYVASKAALIGFSKALAYEVAPRGITVNCIAPGFIETAMTESLSSEHRAQLLARVPMRRAGTANEVAAAVSFLTSTAASYITGTTIHINGGMAML